MINSPYKRAIIATFFTTFLHGSIFYSLYSIEPQKEEKPVKYVEIAMMENINNKEQPKSIETKKEEPKEVEKIEEKIKEEVQEEPIKEEIKEKIPEKKEEVIPVKKKKVVVKKEVKPVVRKEEKKIVAKQEEKPVTTTSNISENSEQNIASNTTTNQQAIPKQVSASELELYLSKIRKKIQINLKYPVIAKKMQLEGEVLIEFEILRSGEVNKSTLQIKRTSGHKSLDKKAMETVAMVSPFDIPPQGNSLLIAVPIVFKIN